MIRTLRATPGRTALLLALTLAAAPAYTRASSTDGVDPDVHFATGQEAGPIPFELVGKHIYVRVRVNGSPPLWFLLDTGATASYLDTGQAIALGIKPHDAIADHIMLRLPGVDLQMPRMRLMPITFRAYDGHEVSGLLGYDFLKHFVVTIDYAARSLSLRAPGGRDDGIRGERLQLTLLEDDSGGRVPLVSARITQAGRPPITGRFILDTGARMVLILNTPFVAAHAMLEAEPRTITVNVGGGAMVRDLKLPIGAVTMDTNSVVIP